MAVMTIQHGGKPLRVTITDENRDAIRASIVCERNTIPERAWRRFVLACSACRRPCLGDVPCACCTSGASLYAHPRLTTTDDFLARAERLAS